MDKILGFLPDADPTTAGVLVSVTNMIPYEQGMKAAPTGATPLGVPVLAAECRGAAVVTKLNDLRRIFAGTSSNLYELSAGSWSSVGSGYTLGVDNRWMFAQFGDSTLAASLTETIQRSSGAGFSNIATAPKAKIVFSVGTQVMALNTNDGTDKPDGWHCCATYDDTDWTPSIATLCAKGRIVGQNGSFTAGARLGEYAVAYKERSIWLGQFVGAPTVWDWVQVVGGDAGCIGQDAVCDIGGSHFFVGQDNFWLFDGSRPIPIGSGAVRQWFFNNSNPQTRDKTKCVFDRQNNTVWCFYCDIGSAVNNKAIVYHVQSKMWGHVDIVVEAALNYISNGVTIDELPSFASTIDGLSSYSFDSQAWIVGGRMLSIFNTSHQLQALAGLASTSSMTTGDMGDDFKFTLLKQVRLRFQPSYLPTSSSIQTYMKAELGGSQVVASTATASDGKFDVLDSGRWHSASFSFSGDCRVMALGYNVVPEGDV